MPIHEYLKEIVLHNGRTVAGAADLLGVSRPTLSNLLNGNADLSPAMAKKIEEQFAVNMRDALMSQTLNNYEAEWKNG